MTMSIASYEDAMLLCILHDVRVKRLNSAGVEASLEEFFGTKAGLSEVEELPLMDCMVYEGVHRVKPDVRTAQWRFLLEAAGEWHDERLSGTEMNSRVDRCSAAESTDNSGHMEDMAVQVKE